jgi:cytochrome c oxidase subunit 4
MAMTESAPRNPAAGAQSAGAHVVPVRTLLLTWGTLLALTAVTIAVSRLHLGRGNLVAALAIASTKAALVASFFMHLKYEGRFHRVILLSSVIFAAILAGFTLFDTRAYQKDIRAYASEHPPATAPADQPAEPSAPRP